jgi:hypothetical protein
MLARSFLLAKPRVPAAIMVLGSVLVVGFLYGANLRARWSVFDDHEIMWFMGSAEQLPFEHILPQLFRTEVSPHSDLPRFRPAYYGLRLLETWAWGKHPAAWYAAHLSILCFFMITIWGLASTRMGYLAAGLLASSTVTLPFWSGIFSALGPGETYAVLGLALYFIGADMVCRHQHAAWGWCLLLFGTIIATGAKENMLLLALPLPFLLWRRFRRPGSKWLPILVVGIAMFWSGWIAFTLVSRLRVAGGDVYANPIGVRDRLLPILGLGRNPAILGLLAAVALFWALWFVWRGRDVRLARASLTCLMWIAAFISLYASQVVFYDGLWPTGTRYDFPGMLIWPGLLVIISWYILELSSRASQLALRVLLAAAIPSLGVVALLCSLENASIAREVAARNVAATAGWTALIDRTARIAREHEDYALVIQSNDPADFEAVLSIPRFLTAYGAPNSAFLLWTPRRRGISNYLGSMSDQLVRMSENGVPNLYMPLARLDAGDTRCILLVVSGRPRWPCRITVNADWRPYYQGETSAVPLMLPVDLDD